jgi:putative ABC transport system permease protein
MHEIMIVDPQTARVLQSIQVASEETEFKSAEETLAFLNADMHSLFDFTDADDAVFDETAFSVEALESFLDSNAVESDIKPLTGGDWNFIIVKLTEGASPDAVINSLNKKLEMYGAVAVGWRLAAGESAIMLFLVQTLFNLGIFIVSVAGIIAAVNILLISLFKRTREIGTLRAIGSGDGFIRLLIMGENTVLALIAGFIAVLCGFGLIQILNCLALTISNPLMASLFGGGVLRLDFIPGIALGSFLMAILLGLFASVYPVEMAVRIDPVIAVRRG